MTNLKDITGINQYCGPAVLSALTGESTDRCAAVISTISGRKEIKATQREHLVEAFKRLRFDVKETIFSGSTLFGTLHRMHTHNGLYVVFVPEHVIAVEVIGTEIYICDNHTKTPLDIKQSSRLTQKVHSVLQIIPRDPPKFVKSEIMLTKSFNKIEVTRVNKYVNTDDNTQYSLGYIKYADVSELEQIINKLAKIGELP